MSISYSNGTISSQDFRRSAYEFAEKWRFLDHGLNHTTWRWIEPTKHPWMISGGIEGYLALERVCFPGSHQEHLGGDNSITLKEPDLAVEDIDNCTLLDESSDPGLYFDLHILHSSSFMVPVLYFRAYFSDGEPLLLGALEKHLPLKSADFISDSKWAFVTCELFLTGGVYGVGEATEGLENEAKASGAKEQKTYNMRVAGDAFIPCGISSSYKWTIIKNSLNGKS